MCKWSVLDLIADKNCFRCFCREIVYFNDCVNKSKEIQWGFIKCSSSKYLVYGESASLHELANWFWIFIWWKSHSAWCVTVFSVSTLLKRQKFDLITIGSLTFVFFKFRSTIACKADKILCEKSTKCSDYFNKFTDFIRPKH